MSRADTRVEALSAPQRIALELVTKHGWLARWPGGIWAALQPPAGFSTFAYPPSGTTVIRNATVRTLIKRGRLEFRDGAARLPKVTP
jgi:hypothetical protein